MQACPPRVLPVPAAPFLQSFEMCCRCPDLRVLSVLHIPAYQLPKSVAAIDAICCVMVFLALLAVALIQLAPAVISPIHGSETWSGPAGAECGCI